MPPLNLAKKLKPARKAWKSFIIKLKSKFESFDVSSSIKSSTRRFLEFCSFHLFAPFKKRFLSKQATGVRRNGLNYHDQLCTYREYQNQPKNNRKVIYIDRLYGEHMSSSIQQFSPINGDTPIKYDKKVQVPQAAETSRRNEEESGGVYSIEDAWKAVVAKSPHLRGVDERADEFIYKFREEGKLEKERSDLDFQEMLARSA